MDRGGRASPLEGSVPSQAAGLTVRPTGAALGAVVEGMNLLEPASADARKALRKAWARHIVLVWRDQALTDAVLLRAASIFGEVQGPPVRRLQAPATYVAGGARRKVDPRITLISNLDETGCPVAVNRLLGSSEVAWHSDYSYDPVPPAGSLLMAVIVPTAGGGETWFNNQYQAFDELPSDLKAAVKGREQVHDDSRDSAGLPRDRRAQPRTPQEVCGARHPLVRRHPVTGRSALYLGRRCVSPSSYIVGMTPGDSDALLDALWAHATQARYAWRHQWRRGDIVLWDNRACMHYRATVDASQARVMHRTMVRGEVPVGA